MEDVRIREAMKIREETPKINSKEEKRIVEFLLTY